MTLLRIASLFIAAQAIPAWSGGLESLESFLTQAKSGRASFTQVVTGPAREGQAARSKTSSGRFEFARPGRFRFQYDKPFVQTIVADGQTLWLHDADLNQVTARNQAQALGATPASLIAATPDLAALRRDFVLEPAPEADGLQWVSATPRAKDGQLASIKIGFKGPELAALDVLDSFGQRSQLRFSQMELNPSLPPATFQFKPPKGAELLRQ